MTGATAFDTHRFVKRLTESGFTVQQGETLAEEHFALLNAGLSSKAGVAGVGTDIEVPRQPNRFNFEKMKYDIVKCMIAGLIVQGGLIVAGIKLLQGALPPARADDGAIIRILACGGRALERVLAPARG